MTTALVPVLVSAVLGLIGIALALRKRTDDDTLARATRRTAALQLLSDEEFSLMLVLDECIAIQRLVQAGGDKLGTGFAHLDREAKRIVDEAQQMLADVRRKRQQVAPQIETMDAAAIEAVIAAAYHGRKLAEAQLQRTRLGRADTVQAYGASAFTVDA